MTIHFVPTEEIQRLTLGSYEHLAAKLDEAISKDAGKVFGASVPNKIERIGTFSDYVLLAADDGRFAKVKYSRGSGGAITVLAAESVTVPLFTEANLDTYLMQEARSIVDSLLAHDASQAELRLRALMPLVQEQEAPSEELVVATALDTLQADRPWKRIFAERAEQVKAFLKTSLPEIESRKLGRKFESLLKDASEEQLETFRELVVNDLTYLSETLATWEKLALIPDSVRKTDTLSESDRALVTTFLAFTEDLQRDIQTVRDTLGAVLEHVNSIASLGQVYDTLAESTFDFEVAARFASAMLVGLQQPE